MRELLTPAIAARAEVKCADSVEGLRESFDAVLIARPDPLESEQVRAIHERLHAQRIVQVTPRGDHAVLYEIWPRRAELGDLDSERLVEILCAPAADWLRWSEGEH